MKRQVMVLAGFAIFAVTSVWAGECPKSDSVHALSLEGKWELDRELFDRNFEGTGVEVAYATAEFRKDPSAVALFPRLKECVLTAGRLRWTYKVKWSGSEEDEGVLESPYVVILHRGNLVILHEERGTDAYAPVTDAHPSISAIMKAPLTERDVLLLGGDHAHEPLMPMKRKGS